MKTVFITSFHQFISRNILGTPILDGLLRVPGVRVVVFAPLDKREYFEKEFLRENLHIEFVDTSRGANGFWSLFFKRAAQAMGGFRYKEISRGFSKKGFRDALITIFFRYPFRLFGKIPGSTSLLRGSSELFVRNAAVNKVFDQYEPSLVFSADAQNENDAIVALEAKRRKIPLVSMIRSWDNVEMYGVLRVIPDALLVWGEFVRQEILKSNVAIDPERVKIVGVPHYDRYLQPTKPREAFFASLGLDPGRKLILFTPVGDMYLKENDVDGFVLQELMKLDANILVRTPPADTASFGFTPPPQVVFYRPGTGVNRTGRKEISRADDDHLINSLHFCDVVVSGPSTIMLDAIFLNKPVVLFGFERRPKPYKESVASLYDSRHLQAVIQKGAVRFAKNATEFRGAIEEYFKNPKKGTETRRSAVEFVCMTRDGKSSERVLAILKSALSH